MFNVFPPNAEIRFGEIEVNIGTLVSQGVD
jgi:hypothetical protein